MYCLLHLYTIHTMSYFLCKYLRQMQIMSNSKTITLFYALLYLKILVHMRNVIFPLQCQVYKRYGTSSNLKNPGSKCIILKKKRLLSRPPYEIRSFGLVRFHSSSSLYNLVYFYTSPKFFLLYFIQIFITLYFSHSSQVLFVVFNSVSDMANLHNQVEGMN